MAYLFTIDIGKSWKTRRQLTRFRAIHTMAKKVARQTKVEKRRPGKKWQEMVEKRRPGKKWQKRPPSVSARARHGHRGSQGRLRLFYRPLFLMKATKTKCTTVSSGRWGLRGDFGRSACSWGGLRGIFSRKGVEGLRASPAPFLYYYDCTSKWSLWQNINLIIHKSNFFHFIDLWGWNGQE